MLCPFHDLCKFTTKIRQVKSQNWPEALGMLKQIFLQCPKSPHVIVLIFRQVMIMHTPIIPFHFISSNPQNTVSIYLNFKNALKQNILISPKTTKSIWFILLT